ncbi:helix-turn-helix domain-containing protein [Roseibacterium sp. SDUM158017]|uniref:helix-turn-helix domain-containing protein n=1 Tax=Roseicyclus salinarum TaxID=3036773 RepID=UPI002415242D|nr:helix-turn-helix transcriptional regulator [Roseibacterium sp. SDUM158017]MDG4648129.1 helix-turn-helix domain-containing protein [Roseibacterium sp. SDUM158017]
MSALPDVTKGSPRAARLTGDRIRERRLLVGMKQAALAEAAGISASYLNLIEHNRRKIGGKLLLALARTLGVDPAFLSEGADATIHDTLQTAARGTGEAFGAVPETDRIDDLAARFPGWTGLIALQQKRIAGLEGVIEGLRDRLSHDPVLSEAMHEILSSVAAIRSTADILARERDLDPAWRGRFHRNLHEEAERLSARATSMLGHFEAPDASGETLSATPIETVEAMFDAADHHFPEIETQGAAAIPGILDRSPGMQDAATRALGRKMLESYAADAGRLPLAELLPAAREAGFDPSALLALAAGDVALVLRRLAALPPTEGAPAFGLAICDASGALLFRRRLASFSIPRFGPGCPLWPLYAALVRPGHPDTAMIEMPQGNRFRAWAVAQAVAQTGFGMAPVVQATMLIAPQPQGGASDAKPVLAGPGCGLCPREACPARR